MSPEAAPLHEISTIETPEHIELDLALAGVGSRALAYCVDLLWQAVPIIAAAFLAFAFLPLDAKPDQWFERDPDGQPRMPLFALAFLSAVVFIVNFGYYALFEVLWKGQTPGKRVLGLRVVRDGGYPIDGRAAFLRNLLRAVDSLPACYFVGIACLFGGRKGKRVGDYAAGTIVVKERKASAKLSVVAKGTAGPLSPTERSLVLEFLTRRSNLDGDARLRVGSELANRLAARLGQASPSDPERFLEEQFRDGNG